MALWNGSAINTNETAKVFNQLSDMKSLPMVVKMNGLLYAMMGKDWNGINQPASGWIKSSKITGKNVEVPLLGTLMAPAGIADGASGETTARTVTYNNNDYGAAEFPIAHYGLVPAIPDSEFMRFKGQEAKTLDWIGEKFDQTVWSYEDVFGTAIHLSSVGSATGAPSRTVLGAWQQAVDDNNTYGTIDRTDAANADFRGVVNATFGDTTLAKLQLEKNGLRKNGGMPKVCVTGETLFSKIQAQLQNYSLVMYDKGADASFGSDEWWFAGMQGIYDQRCTSGVIGLLDPKWWMLIQNDEPFTSTGVFKDWTLKASHAMHTTVWIQLICKKPNAQKKLLLCT